MRHQTELLAPAGSYESLVAAVNAGADAVYMGGTRFGARAYADNPDRENLCRAIRFAHLHGCDLYLTVNTLLKDAELEELGDYLRPYYECGLDAVIVQDLGVFSYIREQFPDLPIHASTQMAVLGAGGAAFLKDLGAARVVTARELSLEELRLIHETVDIEIESFVHGALCYCYSGQCLFSSMLGGRSGNRGRCAQPCRLPYGLETGGPVRNGQAESYLLSPKDMCTLELLPKILEAGVCSLKIEGRMKRPEYTAGVVRIYRKYLDYLLEHGDAGYRAAEEDLKELGALYNRGGFSQGYYRQHNGRNLISLSRPNHFEKKGKKALKEKQAYENLLSQLNETYVNAEKKEKIQGIFKVSTKFPTEFVVQCREEQVKIQGESAQPPKSRPLAKEEMERRLSKTGDTPFVFEKLEIRSEEEVFFPVGQLNQMRRSALEALEERLSGKGSRPAPKTGILKKETAPKRESASGTWEFDLHVQIEDPALLPEILAVPQVSAVYLSGECSEPEGLSRAAGACHRAGKKCILVLPPVFRQREQQFFQKRLNLLREAELDGIAAENLDEVQFLKDHLAEIPVILDHRLYTFNRESLSFWKKQGILYDTLPLELNRQELALRGCQDSELLVYGYLPLMVTAGCLHKTMNHCRQRTEVWHLSDRYQKEFPVLNYCRFCYNVIYNCEPLSLLGNRAEVERLAPKSLRLCFTLEERSQVLQVLSRFVEVYCQGKAAKPTGEAFTRGHFKRGVE